MIHKVFQVIASQRRMVVELSVLALGPRPYLPAVLRADNAGITLARQLGRGFLVLLEIIQISQKQNPGGLLHIVQLAGAARVFMENVVYILEGLLKQGYFSF